MIHFHYSSSSFLQQFWTRRINFHEGHLWSTLPASCQTPPPLPPTYSTTRKSTHPLGRISKLLFSATEKCKCSAMRPSMARSRRDPPKDIILVLLCPLCFIENQLGTTSQGRCLWVYGVCISAVLIWCRRCWTHPLMTRAMQFARQTFWVTVRCALKLQKEDLYWWP